MGAGFYVGVAGTTRRRTRDSDASLACGGYGAGEGRALKASVPLAEGGSQRGR
jgi:hypothetical protein